MTYWNARICHGEMSYSIQFETDKYEYYKMVEKACQDAVDKSDKAREKARKKIRAQEMSVLGHL